jgi:hypothetical protein
MQGPVTVCSDTTFKKLLQIMAPVIQDVAGLGKIFIPPPSLGMCTVAAVPTVSTVAMLVRTITRKI